MTTHNHAFDTCAPCVNARTVNLQLSALLSEARDANVTGDRERTGLWLSALGQQIAEQRRLLTTEEQA